MENSESFYFGVAVMLLVLLFLWIRWYRTKKNLKNKMPNFISYCESNGWTLDSHKDTGLLFCRDVDYEKLKYEYLKENKVQLELPDEMVIKEYIGLNCKGRYDFFDSRDDRDLSQFELSHYFSVKGAGSGKVDSFVLISFNDDVSEYVNFYIYAFNIQVKELYNLIESDKNNRYDRSGGWYSRYMISEENNQWNQLSKNQFLSATMHSAVTKLFIPFKISYVKYLFNQKAFDDPVYYLNHKDTALFSKSLSILQENPNYITDTYPDWFYYAFPDVALWAIERYINRRVKVEFNEIILTDTDVQIDQLSITIQYYLRRNKDLKLEVSTDSDYKKNYRLD